ncbi:MAG: biosynthetic-type acetolactate synthase large subunit [bacterium]
MSKNEDKNKKSTKTKTKSEAKIKISGKQSENSPRRGCEIIRDCLVKQGVQNIFGYPGGASMEIHHALDRTDEVDVILTRHEQGAAFAAGAYARVTGKPGVCMATSGPGATNLITGIQDAMMDSIPLVAITGQVPTTMIGMDAFQESDIVGATQQMTKHNYLIQDIDDIPEIFNEAFYIANSGRPGPVLIDVPKDIQQDYTIPNFDKKIQRPGYDPNYEPNLRQIKAAARAIKSAHKPVIYAGGGVVSGEASEELRELADKTNIPVTTTMTGLGAYPEDKDNALHMLGHHGTEYSNLAISQADLLIAVGVRFDDRVTGKVEEFAKHGKIIHIDIDPAEINKNKIADIPITGDSRRTLEELNKIVEPGDYEQWREQIQEWKENRPLRYKDEEKAIKPQYLCEKVSEMTSNDTIITTGVGQHQVFAALHYTFKEPRTWVSSCGLGAMGFGLPATIGAKLAFPDREVINIDGDGSFMMNIQELATLVQHDLGAKTIVLNNYHLGMVVQWEDRFYGGHRGDTYIGDPPVDFVKICEGYNVDADRVQKKENLEDALEKLIEHPGPYVLEALVPHEEHVLPMIPSGGTIDDMIVPDL